MSRLLLSMAHSTALFCLLPCVPSSSWCWLTTSGSWFPHSNHPADPGGPVLVLRLEAGDRGVHISVYPGGEFAGLLHPSLRGFRGC